MAVKVVEARAVGGKVVAVMAVGLAEEATEAEAWSASSRALRSASSDQSERFVALDAAPRSSTGLYLATCSRQK